jgi:hypothetical protein
MTLIVDSPLKRTVRRAVNKWWVENDQRKPFLRQNRLKQVSMPHLYATGQTEGYSIFTGTHNRRLIHVSGNH